MVKFNTSWIPPGSTVASATLKLYVQSVGLRDLASAPINVHPLTQDWTPDAVSYSRRTPAANWTSSGGTFATTVLASVNFSALTNGTWVTFNLPASTVQAWINSPTSNCGVLLKRSTDANPGQAFRHNKATWVSSDHTNASLRPKLEITYTASSNVSPVAHLAAPGADAAVAPDSALVIQAGASDSDGSIVRVDFLSGSTPLASDLSAPFDFRWQHVRGPTNVNLMARAYDNSGASADSAPVQVRIQSTVYAANMNSNPGWTLGSGWQFGKPTGYYSADNSTDDGDPSSGFSGSNVVGYLFNGTMPALASAVSAVTPAINCSGCSNVVLRFYYWLGMGERFNNFKAGIDLSTNGSTWQSLWVNPNERMTAGVWRRMTLNLPAADRQSTVYIRWTMGPGDSYPFCGWNLDDVEVLGSAAPPVLADADGDGMPDAWEIARLGNTNSSGSVDNDGDGVSNYQEYLAGTGPADSNDFQKLQIAAPDSPGVFFDAIEAGTNYLAPRYYALELSSNLLPATWTGVPSLTNVLAENQRVTYSNAAPAEVYYRLRSWLR